jgi:hypothetical protein
MNARPLVLYRIARARYANLSGIGAAREPGRWNFPGQEAIYTSTDKGTPQLERLVHTPKDLIPSNLAIMEIQLSGQWERLGDSLNDPNTGAVFEICSSIRTANARVFRKGLAEYGLWEKFALAVRPSFPRFGMSFCSPGERGSGNTYRFSASSLSNSIHGCSWKVRETMSPCPDRDGSPENREALPKPARHRSALSPTRALQS